MTLTALNSNVITGSRNDNVISLPITDSTTLTEGDFLELSSGKLIKSVTDMSEVLTGVAATTETMGVYSSTGMQKYCGAVTEGLIKVRGLVEGSGGTYTDAIEVGTKVSFHYDATSGYGQFVVASDSSPIGIVVSGSIESSGGTGDQWDYILVQLDFERNTGGGGGDLPSTFRKTITMQTTKKIQFRSTANYIYSSGAGKLDIVGATTTITAETQTSILSPDIRLGYDSGAYMKIAVTDATGATKITFGGSGGAIEIENDTGITLDGDVTIDSAHTFTTGTGDVSVLGDATWNEDKKAYFRDSGLYIYSSADGTLDIVSDGTIALVGKISTYTVSGRSDVTTGYETMFKIDGTLDSTGSSGGVKTRGLHIDLERPTATVTNGDSRDTALMVNIKDSVGDHTAGYFIRAMDVKAEFDSAGKTITNMYAAQFTAEVDNGTSTDFMVATFNSKVDGVVTNDAICVRIYDESQGTVSGDHIGLQFQTKNVAPASGIRDHVMEITCADSTGWKNLFHLTDATGGTTCVKTGAACDTDGQDSDGAIRIDVNGTAYYIAIWNAAHTSNSW